MPHLLSHFTLTQILILMNFYSLKREFLVCICQKARNHKRVIVLLKQQLLMPSILAGGTVLLPNSFSQMEAV